MLERNWSNRVEETSHLLIEAIRLGFVRFGFHGFGLLKSLSSVFPLFPMCEMRKIVLGSTERNLLVYAKKPTKA